MIRSSMGIAEEGKPVIYLTALGALIFALVHCLPLAILFFAFCFFSVHFFRDPERVIPQDSDVAVSPADGRIIKIEERIEPVTQEKRVCISIFMNVFNVHVNRAPLASEVVAIRYFPGKFINASFDKASEDNERCAWNLKDKDGNVWGMVQIAGLIARRIVCRAEIGDVLQRGERYGMIRFGSRVDLYLPDTYCPCVFVGDHVFAGQSIVAQKK